MTLVAALVLAPGVAAAHAMDAAASPAVGHRVVLALLLAGAALYARGLARRRGAWPTSRVLAAVAGALTIGLAVASPLDALAHASLAAHMTQHTLLTVVAAPLLAAARPLGVFAAALPRAVRLPRFLVVPSPGVACALHAVALWAWHLPGPYGAALGSPALHAAAHASLLGTAALLWWSISRGRARLAGVLWLFATALHAGALGGLLAIAPRPWFSAHAGAPGALADQQLAGLIMWVPAGAVMTALALALAAGWLRDAERRTPGLEGLRDRRDVGG